MEKLIITASVDSTGSYPGNSICPPCADVDRVADEYVRSVNAGASIAHLHGVRELEKEVQPDGRRVSRLLYDGWKQLQEKILAHCQPIVQFGVASSRFANKVELLDLHPDMMSINFTSHDEYFQPDPSRPANEVYAVHPMEELRAYCRVSRETNVKMEIEAFHSGAFWKIGLLRQEGLLDDPLWITLFLGWPGGSWTPPTQEALVYSINHLPKNTNWNLSCMHPPTYWALITAAIASGGHVRVGWEDNPFLENGEIASSNALLVEKTVRIAREIGREIASPQEARQIVGLEPHSFK